MKFSRRGWDSLSEKYRRRLERNGITQQQYESGASLTAARGKSNAAAFQAELAAYKLSMKNNYSKTSVQVDRELRGKTREEKLAIIRTQQQAEAAFNPNTLTKNRPKTKAHKIWKMRDEAVVEWMYWYHGMWS